MPLFLLDDPVNLPTSPLLILFLSCAAPAPSWRRTDAATWQSLRGALEAERASKPRLPWAARVSVSMREPHSGQVVEGRGAMAVAPGRAVRMVLVGAAGATMLDVWVTTEQWRLAIPAADRIRRSDAKGSDARGSDDVRDLPIGFLRWLFFTPLQGTLFAGAREPDGLLFMLRDGEVVLEVRLRSCDRGRLTTTSRRSPWHTERLDECRASNTLQPGDWVVYQDENSGLYVHLAIESVANEPPDDVAFRDPDMGGEAVY